VANRYDTITTKKIVDSKSKYFGETYYTTNVYPEIPLSYYDGYIITTFGDRLDLIAYDFYGDSSMWWIIAIANSLPGDSMFPPTGTQLRIPADPNIIYTAYKSQNRNN
jgi:hypothetical protein